MDELLIASGIILVIGIFWFFSWIREKNLTEAMEALAASLSFSFSKKGEESLLSSLQNFHLFSRGHAKRIRNVMTGCANDINVTIMDYRYTTGHGKSSRRWKQTVILFQTALLELPVFALRPESIFHKIGSVFGQQDIDFDSHPAFSKHYLLQGDDEVAIRKLFSKELLDYYEQNNKLSSEGAGDTLLFYKSSKRVPPADVGAFMKQGFGLFTLLKS